MIKYNNNLKADYVREILDYSTETGKFIMRILVCGGRNYTDRQRVYQELNKFSDKIMLIIHGSCNNQDSTDILAEDWAKVNQTIYIGVPAKWSKYGDSAGPIRNQWMLDNTRPTHILAFPGGKGTKDMIERAKKAGIPVIEIA